MFELKPYTRKNNGVYYNPFQTMDEFERNFFNPSFFETSLDQFKTDIKDEGDSYTLEADLPGFEKKDLPFPDITGTMGVVGHMQTLPEKNMRMVCPE